MNDEKRPSRRQALKQTGTVAILASGPVTAMFRSRPAGAHVGHDHAPRTILDLKGKLVRIIGPDGTADDDFRQDRVTIRVNSEGRIVDLVYG